MGKRYLLTYDLLKPGQNYDPLYQALVQLRARRVLLSVWVLDSAYTAEQLRDHLRRFIDANDRLLVTEMGPDWASFRALVDLNNI